MQRTVTYSKRPTDHSVVTEGDHAGIKILQIQPSVPPRCSGSSSQGNQEARVSELTAGFHLAVQEPGAPAAQSSLHSPTPSLSYQHQTLETAAKWPYVLLLCFPTEGTN